MLTQGGKILCRTCLRVKRSINSETEKKDRSMAVLVGAILPWTLVMHRCRMALGAIVQHLPAPFFGHTERRLQ